MSPPSRTCPPMLCRENLTLNREKCHFTVRHEIILGHEISKKGIEADRVKIEVITKLSMPKCVKDIRSFLGHACFYRRFIKDFSKIARPLTNLLVKDVSLTFCDECINSWEKRKNLISAPDWSKSLEIMWLRFRFCHKRYFG